MQAENLDLAQGGFQGANHHWGRRGAGDSLQRPGQVFFVDPGAMRPGRQQTGFHIILRRFGQVFGQEGQYQAVRLPRVALLDLSGVGG